MSSSSSKSSSTTMAIVGLAGAAIVSLLVYQTYYASSAKTMKKNKKKPKDMDDALGGVPSIKKSRGLSGAETPLKSNTSPSNEKALHIQIEELDKKGKALFKTKNYLEAAHAFTQALEIIEQHNTSTTTTSGSSASSVSLSRQVITLTNNRSAMYEKGGLDDLALLDCASILELEVGHNKARTRRLRIFESKKLYKEALVEACALQLKFMQDNRAQLRMQLPIQPPVPQSKLEELVSHIIPGEVERHVEASKNEDRPLPSEYTLTQLLKSFSSYNSWMAKATKYGNVKDLTTALEGEVEDAKKAAFLLKRGRRHVHDLNYDKACLDFEAGLALCDSSANTVIEEMEDDDYPRLLEWVGMARHWAYNMDGALEAYEKCSELEPENADLLVKRAGVKMDGTEHDDALALFDKALKLDPKCTDALLHRANLRLLKEEVDDAKRDLLKCLSIRPDHLLARLRLATLYMATQDLDSTREQLDNASRFAPNSSEVHSYKGEMYFSQGQLAEALAEFEKAIDLEPRNPTPYINAGLVIMNSPPSSPSAGNMPDAHAAIAMFEKAITVDPQMHAAYMHLGQLKLAMATDLTVARHVVELYDQAIKACSRSPMELRDVVGLSILTVAQVEAAEALKMETFSMQ